MSQVTNEPALALENVSRRGFLQGVVGAGALLLAGRWLDPLELAAQDVDPAAAAAVWRPSAFLAIEASGLVRIVAHRSEMGTGIRTTLPAVLADELEADWARVEVVQAPGDEGRYGSQNTDGSRSARDFFTVMRKLGAAARAMLEAAAAATWGVEPAECQAANHEVVHAASGRKLGFGALVAKAAGLTAPKDPPLKARGAWRYVGKSVKLVDGPAIVSGKAGFGLDVRLPGMKFAVIARSPVLGGKLTRHDAAAAKAVPGVEAVIELPAASAPFAFKALGGVAVIGSTTWAAVRGRKALEDAGLEWEAGANASFDSAAHREAMIAAVEKPGRAIRKAGDADAALAAAAKKVAATYSTPMLAHASMEPPCATARVDEAGCEVWAPTQNPQAARGEVAKALGLPESQVTVNVTLLGGGFGRKSKPDYVVEAALLSRAVKAPVQVVWTREDDVRHDYYHAPSAMHLEAGLDGEGKVTAWLMRSAFPPIASTFVPGMASPTPGELGLGWSDLPFDVPNLRIESADAPAHVRIGWLRAVCNLFHAFAVGSFVDEVARAAGKDPRDFLLGLLGPDRQVDLGRVPYPNYDQPRERYPIDTARLRAVIERVSKEAGWGRELPEGHGLGIAAHRSFLSYVAVVVEAKVDQAGRVSVPRVDIAMDCGTALNPDRVRAQMEGAVAFGLSLGLMGEVTARQGAVVQGNFHDYPVLRLDEAPRALGVHLLESEALPSGAGEPGVPPVAPALANAVFAACGKRVRDLPLRTNLSRAR